MRTTLYSIIILLACTVAVRADVFGTGSNQFTIDFVSILGDASSANGTDISGSSQNYPGYRTFTDPGEYRIGTFEITNDQWNKFEAELGVPVTGSPSYAYNSESSSIDGNVPIGNVSWYEVAQFVNWLNTSTGHHAAYRFTGTQGDGGYSLGVWSHSQADNGTNLYRHKDAFYYIPTEDEWVKAAYWNGTTIQEYANASPGDLVSAYPDPQKWNYLASEVGSPWNVGGSSQELNGTFDMMGNVWEWMENPWVTSGYGDNYGRVWRGGSYISYGHYLRKLYRSDVYPYEEAGNVGFRVASDLPEPTAFAFLALGGLALMKIRPVRRRSKRYR